MTDPADRGRIDPSKGQTAAFLLLMPVLGSWIVLVRVALERATTGAWGLDGVQLVVVLALVWCGSLIVGWVAWRLAIRPSLEIGQDRLLVRRGFATTAVVQVEQVRRVWVEQRWPKRVLCLELQTEEGALTRVLAVPVDYRARWLGNERFDTEVARIERWWSSP